MAGGWQYAEAVGRRHRVSNWTPFAWMRNDTPQVGSRQGSLEGRQGQLQVVNWT